MFMRVYVANAWYFSLFMLFMFDTYGVLSNLCLWCFYVTYAWYLWCFYVTYAEECLVFMLFMLVILARIVSQLRENVKPPS